MSTSEQEIRSVTTDDGAVLLDVKSGTMTALNVCGARVWNALLSGADVNEIAIAIAHETGTSVDVAWNDVDEFVKTLRAAGLFVS